jgi:hypothetical protein
MADPGVQASSRRPRSTDFGRLYRRGGDREDAREQLTTAARMFREMDMRFWLKQAEDEMRSLT